MLTIISGGISSSADDKFASIIKESVSHGDDCMVIIPDQFSFEYDKKLYKLLGAKNFNKITTAGFNRLAELMGKSFGGYAGENANENASCILMFMACKNLKKTGAKYYTKSLDKGSFVAEIISFVGELRESGITPADCALAADKAEGLLKNKLYDISKLYEFYLDGLEKSGLHDNVQGVSPAVDLAKEHTYFKGKDIFISAFHCFSHDEILLIRTMLTQAKSVTANLVISTANNAKSNLSPFAETVKTRCTLEKMAEELSVACRLIECEDISCKNPALEHINKNVFSLEYEKLASGDGVKIISADDVYEEIEYICSEIQRLRRDEGYKYSDIALLIREPDSVRNIISATMERYSVPYFIDTSMKVSQSAFVMYIQTVLKCVLTREYKTENILRMIKSPLTNILAYESSMLEDYCVAWGVEGSMWLSDFTAQGTDIPKDSKYLEVINKIRRKVILPLEKFRSACADSTAKEICEAFYSLLGEIELSEKSYSLVKISMGSDDEKIVEMARSFRQLWEMTVSCITSIFNTIPDEKISLRRYFELLKTMMSSLTIASPPQRLESCIVADSSHSRIEGKRAVFVMSCNDGIFPAQIKAEGLISENDKQRLSKLGVDISRTVPSRLNHERLVCYVALCSASERLYLSWHRSDSMGKSLRQSSLLAQIGGMFERDITLSTQDMPLDFYCPTYYSAYYKYLENFRDKGEEIAILRSCLEENDFYRERLEFINSQVRGEAHHLDDKYAKSLFFSNDINMSASKIESYNKCPFNYFCNYGLKISSPVVDRTAPKNKGLFVHFCLEKLLSYTDENGTERYDKDFVSMNDEEIKTKIHKLFEEYKMQEFCGDFGMTSRLEFVISRWEESTFHIARNIRDELKESLFEPIAFEYSLTREDNSSILQIKSEGEYTINIRGMIDRVDLFTETDEMGNRTRYVRVIDYKTGEKKLSLADIYNGLNLQMILYLLAITRSENSLNEHGELVAAGAMYMPAHYVAADEYSSVAYEKGLEGDLKQALDEYRDKKLTRFGLLVDNKITIDAMEKRSGRFTGVKYKKDGTLYANSEKPYNENFLDGLEDFVVAKIRDMSEKLCHGEIQADPLGNNAKSLPCSYCDYWSVCGNYYPKNPRLVKPDDGDKLVSCINDNAKSEDNLDKGCDK